ncbi:MAG: rod shape-determining protein MreC [Coriobacteriia bacterium]
MRADRKGAPGKSPGLLIVCIILALVVTTVWFREGESGPMHKLRSGVQTIATPFERVGEWVTRPGRGLVAWASDLGVSRSRLDALQAQNTELRSRIASLQEAATENERLTKLLGFVEASELETLGARVIARPTDYSQVLTIDRGSADGITVGMPVLGNSGVVGQTVEVTKHSAKVQLITDSQSGVAALIQSNRSEGVVRGSVSGNLTMEFVSKETTVTAGDVVVTSGIGGVYPKGLLIGEVTKVTNLPAALYQKIELSTAVDPTELEEVVVVIGMSSSAGSTGGE